jgi:uncharacterized protein (DUF433 family)
MELTLELPPYLTHRTDGEVVVTGTRVPLFHFVYHFNQGESPEMLAARYPHIRIALVYQLIGFYLDHQPAVDAFADEYQAELDRLRAAGPALNTPELRQRLAARQ